MTATAVLDTALDRSLLGYSNVGYRIRRRFWPEDAAPDALRGRVAIVTGAKSGLGKATATGLARLGARVHLVVRGREQGEAARADILAAVPGADVLVDTCDVSSFASVRAYADGFGGPLSVLVHNAGVMPDARQLSADGHELSLATHVLGPHLLTRLLRPALGRGAQSRARATGGRSVTPAPSACRRCSPSAGPRSSGTTESWCTPSTPAGPTPREWPAGCRPSGR
jgi:dehydrogenase/reductase SDR family protein 12